MRPSVVLGTLITLAAFGPTACVVEPNHYYLTVFYEANAPEFNLQAEVRAAFAHEGISGGVFPFEAAPRVAVEIEDRGDVITGMLKTDSREMHLGFGCKDAPCDPDSIARAWRIAKALESHPEVDLYNIVAAEGCERADSLFPEARCATP